MKGSALRIPPELHARLRDLRLSMRGPSSGDGLGMHASRSRGAGLEFAQYRGYEPGDEPRRIDWKLFARSDRYFVREAERDSPLTVWILIDASASMAQSDRARPQFSKLEAARILAACVIDLALRQGDRFGIVGLSAEGLQFVAEGAGPRQRDRCMVELERLKSAGSGVADSQLTPLWDRVRPGSLVILLGDGFDERLMDLAVRLSATRREVASIQLLTAEERDFSFRGGLLLRDPETGTEMRVDAERARKEYLDRFAAARTALARRLAANGVAHAEHVLDRPLDEPLRALFGAAQRAVERR
ncbi:DUF58 domain-containing protein [Dokdonella sp.]|uniref:DUF58 domain-containing protein n=1 Tax=Dokdonella sp. TaxID=2291710 RepID=UPI003C530D87